MLGYPFFTPEYEEKKVPVCIIKGLLGNLVPGFSELYEGALGVARDVLTGQALAAAAGFSGSRVKILGSQALG